MSEELGIHQESYQTSPLPWDCWYDQETKRGNSSRIEEIARRHSVFIDMIHALNPSTAIEIGIGTGLISHTVAKKTLGIHVVALDINSHLLTVAQQQRLSGIDTNLAAADTFALPFGSTHRNSTVIFHQGLLEHFSDSDIFIMLQEQLRVARTVVVSVPSCFYAFPSGLRGDERLMSIPQWEQILSPHFQNRMSYYGENPGEQYHICMLISASWPAED